MALPFCADKNVCNDSHCLISSGCNKKSTQNVPIQKNGFIRHREPVQNPSVFKSLVLFKDRMVTNCLMQFCLAIPCRQIACLRDILPHWNFIGKGKINFHHDKRIKAKFETGKVELPDV